VLGLVGEYERAIEIYEALLASFRAAKAC